MMRKRLILAAAVLLAMAVGRGAFAQSAACCNDGISIIPAGQQCVLLHKVGPGENLHILAAYYYGDARAWTRIYQANKKQIRNPNVIMAGQVLRIEVPPCWTPRFDLQEFLRLEQRRMEIMQRAPEERPREFRQREVVETKMVIPLEPEAGGTVAPGAPQELTITPAGPPPGSERAIEPAPPVETGAPAIEIE